MQSFSVACFVKESFCCFFSDWEINWSSSIRVQKRISIKIRGEITRRCIFCVILKYHSNHCPHELIHCENKCGQQLQRQFLINHSANECPKRLLPCPHGCSTKDFTFDTLPEHFPTCSRFPLKCPNKCTSETSSDHSEPTITTIPRNEMATHLRDVCQGNPRVLEYCSMRSCGCPFKGSSVQMKDHMTGSRDRHLELMTLVVAKQASHIAVLTSALNRVQARKGVYQIQFVVMTFRKYRKRAKAVSKCHSRQQSIRDYNRFPDACVERPWRVCRNHERRATDVHSIITIFDNEKSFAFAKKKFFNWTKNKISKICHFFCQMCYTILG